MLNNITPLILTRNEAPNIGRVLKKLYWAKDIVVVDSFSTDETLEIISHFSAVRVFQRVFDSHSQQWDFGLNNTQISSDWVLALDADYILTDGFIDEIRAIDPQSGVNGYRVDFIYYSLGHPLRANLYPHVTVLYRRMHAVYMQDGHTHRVVVQGKICDLKTKLLHDDRKSLSAWLSAQNRYAVLEAYKLTNTPWEKLKWPDKIRQTRIVAPLLIYFYCLIFKGLLFDGWPGIWYALQRMMAETLLSLHLLERDVTDLKN